jgi:hypothetical protein
MLKGVLEAYLIFIEKNTDMAIARNSLRWGYCGIFAQSKNCGARETAADNEWLWNNIRFQATAAKQTTERRPLLGSRILISNNRRPLLGNGSVNTFPRELLAYENGVVCAGRDKKL